MSQLLFTCHRIQYAPGLLKYEVPSTWWDRVPNFGNQSSETLNTFFYTGSVLHQYYLPRKSSQHSVWHLCSFKTTLSASCSRPWPLHDNVSLRRAVLGSCLRCHSHISPCGETANFVSICPDCLQSTVVEVYYPFSPSCRQRDNGSVESIGLGIQKILVETLAFWHTSHVTWEESYLSWRFVFRQVERYRKCEPQFSH